MKYKIRIFIITILLLTLLAGCSSNNGNNISDSSKNTENSNNTLSEIDVSIPDGTSYDEDDTDVSYVESDDGEIALNGNSISYNGEGAVVEGSIITITSPGEYIVGGKLNDGQIIIELSTDEKVQLILNGVDITCKTGPAIYTVNADRTIITLADGTTNTLTDSSTHALESGADEPDACIFSKNDLTINGTGSLIVNANYKNGIKTKDDLKIVDGNITITSVEDGMVGRDTVSVKGGTLNINAGSDGIKTTNEENTEKGYCNIEGGTTNINCGNDGVDIVTDLTITDGKIDITSGDGSNSNLSVNNSSRKGLKANNSISVYDGTIVINSRDDAINCNNLITINGGNIEISTGDDAVRANTEIIINAGQITILKCYEGLESKTITLNGGDVNIVASDDGINGTDGSSSVFGGGFDGGGFSSGTAVLEINGGQITVNAEGDGIDINGSIVQTGGNVIVLGPTANNNGALDYDGTYVISGGTVVALGSSGMAQTASTSSSQCSVIIYFTSTQAKSSVFSLLDAEGNEIIAVTAAKQYQSAVVSSAALIVGQKYTVDVNETQVNSFTQSTLCTTVGSGGGMIPGGRR
ncbi:MAG: hypothetical protein A2Y17_03155 [Clostridiales bacterium GWF2_38_85]|nr:MAG: hypothetical protein A2Y17_03155 [Clostridiales bacterium GWF2_38_85]